MRKRNEDGTVPHSGAMTGPNVSNDAARGADRQTRSVPIVTKAASLERR